MARVKKQPQNEAEYVIYIYIYIYIYVYIYNIYYINSDRGLLSKSCKEPQKLNANIQSINGTMSLIVLKRKSINSQ